MSGGVGLVLGGKEKGKGVPKTCHHGGSFEPQSGQRASYSGQRASNSDQRVSQSNQKVSGRCEMRFEARRLPGFFPPCLPCYLTELCTVYSVQCTLCTVYSVQCTPSSSYFIYWRDHLLAFASSHLPRILARLFAALYSSIEISSLKGLFSNMWVSSVILSSYLSSSTFAI